MYVYIHIKTNNNSTVAQREKKIDKSDNIHKD